METTEQGLAVYEEFRAQLADLEKWNSQQVFDYEDPLGNKEARSHIYKLRQTKGAVERVRKAEKQEVLDRGRRIDGEAKDITARLDAMIAVHQAPLDAIEQREKDRQAKHEAALERLRELATVSNEPLSSAEIEKRLRELESYTITEMWEEYAAEAMKVRGEGQKALQEWLDRTRKHEEEQRELDRLRREKAEREQAERDERIRKEAAARAQREAEEKAQREKEAADRRVREAEERAERAEQERKDAIAREERRRREAAEARQKQQEWVEQIDRQVVAALKRGGLDQVNADQVLYLLKEGKLPNVTINY